MEWWEAGGWGAGLAEAAERLLRGRRVRVRVRVRVRFRVKVKVRARARARVKVKVRGRVLGLPWNQPWCYPRLVGRGGGASGPARRTMSMSMCLQPKPWQLCAYDQRPTHPA